MDPKRYQRMKNLVEQALDLPERERDVFLQQECEDGDLLAQARDLLLHYRSDSEGAAGGSGSSADLPKMAGQKIGPYQIIEPLGEGGMGVVYLAGQSAPLRRKVALKVIKLGMDTREVIIRFESERQALAMMDHQNIAKVYDAGATNEGRPFFVMEFIQGIPLNRYCDEHKLGLQDRLNLFIQVCHGVNHAHQKGIIHRDLKPGNILVTEVEGKPIPKIIDFGVAKATSQHLTAQTLFTQMGQMIGTPEYMSPEQAGSSADDVDTRSDVYSLGVLLYELLTGVLPLEREEIMRAGWERMALLVRNEVPKKPSTRLYTETKQSKGSTKLHTPETRIWIKRIRGDLDWITMKALEKDRDRRYGSAADLATDIGRHLESRAVTAGPPSRLYRMGKFVRRNRAGVVIAAATLAALVGFASWQTVQSRIISRERDKAMANERLSHARGEIEKDPTAALAYAISSLEILDQPMARDVVRKAIAGGFIRHELPHWGQKGNTVSIDASPDGRYCVVPWSQQDHPTVGIYSLEDFSMRIFTAPSGGDVWSADYNADGKYITAMGSDGIHGWRVADGEHVFHYPSASDFASVTVHALADPRKMVFCGNKKGEPTLWFEIDLQEGVLTELGRSRGSLGELSTHVPAIDPARTLIIEYEGNQVYWQRFGDLSTDRATLIGQHDATITSVAIDASGSIAASADNQGHIKVWDLKLSPPQIYREYTESPGEWELEFDPYGRRLFSSWGSETIHVYDLSDTPKRRPLPLLDRTWWAHDASFLPDRSIVSAGNGTGVSYWKSRNPIVWSLDWSHMTGPLPMPDLSQDGEVLYIWSNEGELAGVPLVDGVNNGVGSLGQISGWARGVWANMFASRERDICLTFYLFTGTQILDLGNGTARDLPGFDEDHILMDMSPSGRYAGMVEYPSGNNFFTYDLDSLKLASTVVLGDKTFHDYCLAGDTSLQVLDSGFIARFNLTDPTAPPDTLWRGDDFAEGIFLDDGRSALMRDNEMTLVWVDLGTGREVDLGKAPGRGLSCGDYEPQLGLLAAGGWWDTILVFDVEKGGQWTLPVPGEGKKQTAPIFIDPRGRWLISVHSSEIVAWGLPLDPLFGELEHGELLDSLKSRTNVRVVPDETRENGFRITNSTDMEP